MTFHEERTLTLARSDISDLNEGLSWIVQRHDQEFAHATMVKVVIEQVYVVGLDSEDDHYRWAASISGLISEGAPLGASS